MTVNLGLWPRDLRRFMLNQRPKNLGHNLLKCSLKIIVRAHSQTDRHTHTHTQTDCYSWTTRVAVSYLLAKIWTNETMNVNSTVSSQLQVPSAKKCQMCLIWKGLNEQLSWHFIRLQLDFNNLSIQTPISTAATQLAPQMSLIHH